MKRILLLALLAPLAAFAQKKEKLKPLEFQADRNGVQILAQRFEYALLDAEKLRIGDILIDSAKLRFAFEKAEHGYRLKFMWPAALLTSGNLALLNNNGKAVWSEDFKAEQLTIQADQTITDADIRGEIAMYVSEPVPAAVVDDLKFLPFLNFCVSRQTETTKIYLCSRDFYMHVAAGGGRDIRERSSATKQAQVEINGQEATSQGIIYLNEASEDINIRGQSESGASIELITRQRDVEFSDVTLTNDGRHLVIRARGAQPARKRGVRRIDDDEYEVTLPKERPYYFILGDGGIPMRQEFFIRGFVPTADLRPYLSSASPERTYASEIELVGVHPAKVKVKATEKDASELKPLSKNRFAWTLLGLKAGEVNRRFLTVESDRGEQFQGSYEIYRGRPNFLSLDVLSGSPSGIVRGDLEYRRWSESVFGSILRWGWLFGYDKDLTKKDDAVESGAMTLGLRYRFTPGFAFKDPTGGVGLLATQFNLGGMNSIGPGLEVYKQFAPSWRRFPWWETHFRYWPGSSGADVKLASMWRLSMEAFSPLGERAWLRLPLALSQAKIADAEAGKMQIEFGAGLGLNF